MKKVGEITADESKEIYDLYEKIKAIQNLQLIEMREELKIKVKKDIEHFQQEFDLWWENMAKKYQWESQDKGNWVVNFDSNEIFLTMK